MLIFAVLKFLFILISTAVLFAVVVYCFQIWKYRHFEGITLFRYLLRGAHAKKDVCKLAAEKELKFVKWNFPLFSAVAATHPESLKVIFFLKLKYLFEFKLLNELFID
jgi:hypothetical protein